MNCVFYDITSIRRPVVWLETKMGSPKTVCFAVGIKLYGKIAQISTEISS